MDLQKVGCGYMDWIGLAQDRDEADTCECGNELSGSVKCGGISWLAANQLASQEGLYTGLLKTSCQQTCMTYTVAVCTVKKTPDDGQRNCPKHVEFYFKNKFEKLMHLVGFIIRIY